MCLYSREVIEWSQEPPSERDTSHVPLKPKLVITVAIIATISWTFVTLHTFHVTVDIVSLSCTVLGMFHWARLLAKKVHRQSLAKVNSTNIPLRVLVALLST